LSYHDKPYPLIKEEANLVKTKNFFSGMKSIINKIRPKITEVRRIMTALIRNPSDEAELAKIVKIGENYDTFEFISLVFECASTLHSSLGSGSDMQELS